MSLYQKIGEFVDSYQFKDLSLEELFLEADRIGNKYLTDEEREAFNQEFNQEVSEISTQIDRQFPDTEMEVVDFGNKPDRKSRSNSHQKSYRTTKV
ncbi:MAG: hypothetical protein HC881_10245 [Leptolyngbyaceae cyanobacterium SL_7_1]|nr:hypothetical protein [Leptolyngbyaceae cyanobacterium SL_7_1]